MMPEEVVGILNRLVEHGYEAYAVGGCVRDTLLGRAPQDWDIATSARPQDVARCFAPQRLLETGMKHGTVALLLGGGLYEITSFRVDGEYADHRRPDCARFGASLEEDCRRRDITINAMAMDADGKVIDLVGGRRDLEARLIRCVGEPEKRFSEDALRVLRVLRFSATLDFEVEAETRRALVEAKPLLSFVSRERVLAELKKLLCGRGAARVLRENASVFEGILPVPERALEFLDRLPPEPEMRFAALLTDAAPLRALKAERALIQSVDALCRARGETLSADPAQMRCLLRALGEETTFRLVAYKRAETPALVTPEIEDALREARGSCWRVSDLRLTGRDLIALGARGRGVGELLETLLERVLEGRLPNEREALLAAAKRTLAPEAPSAGHCGAKCEICALHGLSCGGCQSRGTGCEIRACRETGCLRCASFPCYRRALRPAGAVDMPRPFPTAAK